VEQSLQEPLQMVNLAVAWWETSYLPAERPLAQRGVGLDYGSNLCGSVVRASIQLGGGY